MPTKILPAKYVIIDNSDWVIFHPNIEHVDANQGRNATSAGFLEVSVRDEKICVECWGESNSLGNLKSKPEQDAELLRKGLLNFAYNILDRALPVISPNRGELDYKGVGCIEADGDSVNVNITSFGTREGREKRNKVSGILIKKMISE